MKIKTINGTTRVNGLSKTVPGMTMDFKTLFSRYTTGQPVPINGCTDDIDDFGEEPDIDNPLKPFGYDLTDIDIEREKSEAMIQAIKSKSKPKEEPKEEPKED